MSSDPLEGDAARDDGPAEATPCAYTDYEARGVDPTALPATGEGATGVEARVWDALYGVDDPEMPVSVVDLGLLYGVTVEDGHARVEMTLTYTGCPARKMLTGEVEEAVRAVEGVESVDLELVWSPPWSVDLVTDDGREALREFGLSVP